MVAIAHIVLIGVGDVFIACLWDYLLNHMYVGSLNGTLARPDRSGVCGLLSTDLL